MNKQKVLETVEINPKVPAKASVIWLHGLGADGYDFANIVPEFNLPEDMAVRFVFPHAPLRSVTINAGYQMRAWFDIYALHVNAPLDEVGIGETHLAINNLIDKEIARGIPTEKIVLAGFSQGGAAALYCGLLYDKPLAGVLGLSTFLPLIEKLVKERNPANDKMPIMLAHGTLDDIVPIQLDEITRDFLKKLGYPVDWHTYPMAHQVCNQEIRDIASWLQRALQVRNS